MSVILTVTGIFAGIGMFLAAMYSASQILLLTGRGRVAHAVTFGLILVVMAALMERWIDTARVSAVLLFGAAFWTLVLEARWYRVFPLLTMLFAVLLMMGYVALSPLPG
ncbi:MAG: hypothetical protein AAGB15_14180 [Pseudomonadota bacterium]